MRFTQIDRIIDLKPGESITAIKCLTLAEEYLKDHFPLFPVMPGVLMLEAMYQASAWLVRHSENFASAFVLLKEARNVKYADFVKPGQVLTVTAEVVKQDQATTSFKASGTVNGQAAVSARLVLERFNIRDRDPSNDWCDSYARRKLREMFELLYPQATGG
jgi:3-hydroxyacyl-[acyl-carrier-protein] dehydratase